MEERRDKRDTILGQRVYSLVDDGYYLVSIYSGKRCRAIKMRHRCNSNVVTIVADVESGEMTQKTNGVITYKGEIQP